MEERKKREREREKGKVKERKGAENVPFGKRTTLFFVCSLLSKRNR